MPLQDFHNMTLQFRKSHNSLEVDGSQMGKQAQRERMICPPPTQSCTRSSPGGQGMLTRMAFRERQELMVSCSRTTEKCIFHPLALPLITVLRQVTKD